MAKKPFWSAKSSKNADKGGNKPIKKKRSGPKRNKSESSGDRHDDAGFFRLNQDDLDQVMDECGPE